MTAKKISVTASALGAAAILCGTVMTAAAIDVEVAREEGGRYYNADDIPTYFINDAGEVDWLTFSGFRRYHSECHVCHGPDGEGSSYAPPIKESVLDLDYYDYLEIVASGRKVVGASSNSVMPAFGTNKNVMCYVDDIYVYLMARATDVVPRGRPAKKVAKSNEIRAAEAECMDN
jgi:methanol metabolism-related c-type cytochrome